MSTPTDCYLPDGQPIKCWKCGSTNIKQTTVDVIAVLDNGTGPECERKEDCADCGAALAYWAYGYYDTAYVHGAAQENYGGTA